MILLYSFLERYIFKMALTLRLLAILGLFALSTLPFAMAEDSDDDQSVVVSGDEGDEGNIGTNEQDADIEED
jgi:hypothetical protein